MIDKENAIFQKIKNHIHVTWDYQDEDILDTINEGIEKIEGIAGPTEFEAGKAMSILKAYCRYAWNGSESLFEESYRRDLLQLQLKNAADSFRRNSV